MTRLVRRYVSREEGESLAMHLFRNSEALAMTRDQVERARRAAVLSMGGPVERADAGVIASALRDELRASLDAVIYAAQARGEMVVDVRNEAGELLDFKRLLGRDGLASLFDSKALSERQWNTGLVYRELYELAGVAVVGSQLGKVDGAAAVRSSTSGLVAAGLRRAYAGVRLTQAETAVGSVEGVAVLRAVAGEGRTIRSMFNGGKARQRATGALAAALDLVRPSLADTGGLRIGGH